MGENGRIEGKKAINVKKAERDKEKSNRRKEIKCKKSKVRITGKGRSE
jgi:hypothetical protein